MPPLRSATIVPLVIVLALGPFLPVERCIAAEPSPAGARPPDLARVKEEEAREKLERLEDTMDRLSRLLAENEPQNAAKLRLAFQESRTRLLREGMERIVKYLEERKLDRAIEAQDVVRLNLEEILSILLEKDMDPREILKHIRRIRDIAKDMDKVIDDETRETMASDDATTAGASQGPLAEDLAKLEDLIRREKELEKGAKDPSAAPAESDRLAAEQARVRRETKALREGDAARAQAGPPSPGESKAPPTEGAPTSGEASPKEGGAGNPPPETPEGGKPPEAGGEPGASANTPPEEPKAEPMLDKLALERAEEAMNHAESAFGNQKTPEAQEATRAAREALEEAVSGASDKLARLAAARQFPRLKEDQDQTKKDTDALVERMREPPPLVSTPEGGVPGQSDMKSAGEDMQSASSNLGAGEPRKASSAQKKALDKLQSGREKTEEALEELQRAFRERLLAYLREKFTRMLADQRAIAGETKSLDLRLRALRAALPSGSEAESEPERKDRQLAESLSARETALTGLADAVLDVLAEDGTTLVFPGAVEEIRGDIELVAGLLGRIQTGERTLYLEHEIETAIEEILKILDMAQRSPPPPDPSKGRQSKSGAGPLLPMSTELKLVRSLQARVNERTRAFDLARKADQDPSPEEKLQVDAIAKKQKDVEALLRKLGRAVGEEP